MSDNKPCPATIRHDPPNGLVAIGVQCKYTIGHDGHHAGYAGFGSGDIFWPQDKETGSAADS